MRRHPHIFGEQELAELPTDATTPSEVRQNWDAIKLREGRGTRGGRGAPGAHLRTQAPEARVRARTAIPRAALERVARAREAESPDSHHGSQELYEAVGELLLAVVELAGELRVDPEIALRRAVPA